MKIKKRINKGKKEKRETGKGNRRKNESERKQIKRGTVAWSQKKR